MDADYHRNYYHTKVNKARKLLLQRERLLRHQDYIREYLLTHPCKDCGEADPVVLEFDHVSGEKDRAVSDGLRNGWSLSRIKAEIAKCEVRCANCHRRKTALQLNWRLQ